MRFYLLSVLLVPFLLVSSLRAQELTPVFENITEGLPSTEVHDMFQDSIGYMWFATDRGICRYNGDEMKIIDTDKDIPTNVFFKFFKETETKVWLLTKNTTLYSFNPLEAKPKFRAHVKNDELESGLITSKYVRNVSDLRFEKNDIIMLFRSCPGYLVIPQNNKCYWVKGQNKFQRNEIPNHSIHIKKHKKIFYTQLSTNENLNHESDITIFSQKFSNLELEKFQRYSDLGISCQIEGSQGTYVAVSNYLFRIYKNNISLLSLPTTILSIIESNGKLFIGTYDGIFECELDLTIRNHIFKNLTVTKLAKDKDDNFWLSSLQKGVFVSKNINIKELPIINRYNVTDFTVIGESLFGFDEVKRKAVVFGSNNKITYEFSEIISVNDFISFYDHNIVPLLTSTTKVAWTSTISYTNNYSYYSKEVDPISFITHKHEVYCIDNGKVSFFYRFPGKIKATTCYQLNPKTLLTGTNNGIYLLDTSLKSSLPSPLNGTERMHFFSSVAISDTVFLASDHGIHYYVNNKLHYLLKLPNNKIASLFKENDKTIWTWSDNEVYKIKIDNGIFKFDRKKLFSTSRENTIIDLVVFNGSLWISTKTGVQVIDLKNYKPSQYKSNYSFITDSILVDSKRRTNYSSIRILDNSTMTFFFSTICFDQSTARKLEYTIDGETWLETNKNSIVISNLSSGEYLLQIRRIDDPSKILFILPIHVSKIWYQSNWFIGLCSMLTLIFVAFIIFQFFKSRDKKRSAELDKLNLELKLLTSKMNPHFTFNTINSIQYYILKSDKKEAIQYLSDFALLIRKSLDFSMAERITIEDEIHFLSLYVKMENKRFDSNFRLKFDLVPPNIVQSKKIPSMLIQPLVENIILHAGYSEDEDKLINIKIVYSHSFFTIEVIDHGKGIQAKDDFSKHKSYGIDILKSRVKIYNSAEFRNSDVNIQSTSVGTTVTIRLKEWE